MTDARLWVDLPHRKVIQYPGLGVRTKKRKSRVTFLLDIPELLNVIQEGMMKRGYAVFDSATHKNKNSLAKSTSCLPGGPDGITVRDA